MILMVFKYALIVLTGAVSWIVTLLDYKWHDKRTRLFKRLRQALFILIPIGVAGAIVASKSDDDQMQRRFDGVQTSLKDIKEEVHPIVVAMQTIKPGATENQALALAAQRLSQEVEHVNARVDEMEYRQYLLSSMHFVVTYQWKTRPIDITGLHPVPPTEAESSAELIVSAALPPYEVVAHEYSTTQIQPTVHQRSFDFAPPTRSPLLGKPLSALTAIRYVRFEFCDIGPVPEPKIVSVTISLSVNGVPLPELHAQMDCSKGDSSAPRSLDISNLTASIEERYHVLTGMKTK